MNAHTPILTTLALENAALLRRLANGRDYTSIKALADELGRDDSNLGKSFKALASAGLVTKLTDGRYTLTGPGEATREALDRADGLTPADPAAAPRALHALFAPNPDQPRQHITAEMIATRADTIEQAGEVLQNLIVYPPGAHGVRMIADGEVRWRAVGLLIGQGRCPAILLDQGLRYEERPYEAGDPELVALMSNTGAPLDPLDEARAMLALHKARGWTAREICRHTGRWTEGDVDKGIRLVQQRIRVAREATAENLAKYRTAEEFTWEWLRKTVEVGKDVAPGPTPKQRLALAEILDRLTRLGVDWAPIDHEALRKTSDFNLVQMGLVMILSAGDKSRIQLTDSAMAQAAELGIGPLADDTDQSRLLLALREAAYGAAVAFRCDRENVYATPWLNVAAQQIPASPPPSPPPADARQPADRPTVLVLNAIQTLRMAELHHALDKAKRWSDRFQTWTVGAAGHWLDAEFSTLKDLRLVDARVEEKGGGWFAMLTRPGLDWLNRHVPLPVNRGWLAMQRQKAGLPGAEGGYSTPWLNPAGGAAPAADPIPSAPAEARAIADDEGPSAAELAEAQHARLAIEQALAARTVLTGFGDIMETAQLRGPFTMAVGAPAEIGLIYDAQQTAVITVDQSAEHPEDLAIAQTAVVLAALNAAGGYGPPIVTAPAPDAADQSPTAILARALIEVRDWMLNHYDAASAVPMAEAIYRNVSQALNAADMARRAQQREAAAEDAQA